MTTILFSWGYYGWGNHTPQLVKAVDAVEASRGFQPPIFVDIRIRRTVRATGFQGRNFSKFLGPSRHRWMRSLGNEFIVKRTGKSIQIADPSAAEELLDVALDAAKEKQRVLFFCSCQWPRCDGKVACHRTTVADLVLEAAAGQKKSIEIIEWPGGEPKQIDVDVPADLFKALEKGRVSIPLKKSANLASFAGLPWGSIVTVQSSDQAMRVISGPAICQPAGWVLPVFWFFLDPESETAEIEEQAAEMRRSWGLGRRQSQG